MSIENIHYRVATPEDQAFLDDMNIVVGFGPYALEDELPDTQAYLQAHPQYAGYSSNFGLVGDMGLIALDQKAQPVGAVWGRDYSREDDSGVTGHSFELAIALRERARGRGIGRQLLDSFAVMAWLQGRDELSLSVRIDNPAHSLYSAAGFKPILSEDSKELRDADRFVPMARQLNFGPPVLRAETLYEDPKLSFASIKLRGRNATTINHVSTTAYSVVRGEGTMTVGGVVHELKPSVTVKVPQGTPYFDEGNVDMKAVSYPPFNIDDVEVVQG